MPDFDSMPIYVDPVRVDLPFLLIAAIAVAVWRWVKRKKSSLESDVLFHGAGYLAFVCLLYEAGAYDEAGFFLFPADQLVKLVHHDPFTGGLSVIAASYIWGCLSAIAYPRLMLYLFRWVVPESKGGWFAFRSTLLGILLWLRYLLIYPLLLIPSLFFPLNIHSVSFHVDIMMMNICTALFFIILVAALVARQKVARLAALSLLFVVFPVILIPLTTWLSN